MKSADRWLLPEGVEEVLPPQALKLETLRRDILDLYQSWGYELVVTPLIEYLDSLLVGSSHDLDLHTFKLTDQMSGRMMGLRADITPQVARIDARNMHRNGPARLCYADSVVHTRPRGLLTSRVPIRIGAELFGSASVSADVELIVLMSRTLSQAGIGPQHIVLGHVGLFRGLVAAAELEAEQEAELFDAVQRKAFADIDIWLDEQVENINLARMLKGLCRLSGDITVLDEAEQVLAHAPPQVRQALDELRKTAEAVQKRLPDHSLGFDLSELRGYQYHTGTVFAAYTPGYGRAVAKGGRYDEIGQAYGRARPASGFDADLKILARLSSLEVRRPASILAPDEDDAALQTMVEDLRRQGEVVITHLDEGEADAALLKELSCDRRIVAAPEGGWQLVTI
ncbi:ATP phosphoribosyltransferase regulatory subunit [Pseudohongiella nitratireducens]|uniref:ATP phosphoribosyltransferase regulatory subunit n=1 Tax=Pseudohongiella nitratireducens TaxID=1768907 RepID=A0A916QLG5_9GAMM|nr:ATP phosphoribosyltransferase regulatory subunit [Pseudohongiella nitratireducens]MDF1623258.1 ATP phosphoribosyltransferase regulatory subunit [Pseudohongiella nitratireducens]GFZ75759.1 ATP phosphoribosyltransferase regulatory subunit [Pseudohongiella nitratireducens]